MFVVVESTKIVKKFIFENFVPVRNHLGQEIRSLPMACFPVESERVKRTDLYCCVRNPDFLAESNLRILWITAARGAVETTCAMSLALPVFYLPVSLCFT